MSYKSDNYPSYIQANKLWYIDEIKLQLVSKVSGKTVNLSRNNDRNYSTISYKKKNGRGVNLLAHVVFYLLRNKKLPKKILSKDVNNFNLSADNWQEERYDVSIEEVGVKNVFNYRPKTGGFVWRDREVHNQQERTFIKKNKNKPIKCAINQRGYSGFKIFGVRQESHWWAWYWMTGFPPPNGTHIHHRDGDKSNNRWDNLMLVDKHFHGMMHSLSKITVLLKIKNEWVIKFIKRSDDEIVLGKYKSKTLAIKAAIKKLLYYAENGKLEDLNIKYEPVNKGKSRLPPSKKILDELFTYKSQKGELLYKLRPPISQANRKFNTQFAGKLAGKRTGLRIQVHINHELYLGHEVVWKMYYGFLPKKGVFPENGNWKDLRISNLKENMPYIPPKGKLTQERLRFLLKYNKTTGVFIWRKVTPSCIGDVIRNAKPGSKIAGANRHGYTYVQIDGESFPAGQLAILYIDGFLPKDSGLEVDHSDQIKNNNCYKNLVVCRHKENMKNQPMTPINTSGCIGVRFIKERNKWRATITVNKKHKHLGMFNNKKDAVSARKDAEIKYGFSHHHGVNKRRKQN